MYQSGRNCGTDTPACGLHDPHNARADASPTKVPKERPSGDHETFRRTDLPVPGPIASFEHVQVC